MDLIPLWVFILAAVAVVAIALLAGLLLRLNRRLASFKEEMALHSELMLRLKLREENAPVIWWDPTVEPWPDVDKRHRNRSEFTHVVLGIPDRLRWGTIMGHYMWMLATGLAGALVAAFWLFGWTPVVGDWVVAWQREILFAAFVLFGLLFLYALAQCARKLFQREWLRQNAPPAQTPEKR